MSRTEVFALPADCRPSIADQLSQGETWTGADGRVWPLDRMGEEHVQNVIALLIRCAGVLYDDTVQLYATITSPNGEMARDAFEDEFDALIRTDAGSFVADSELMHALRKRLDSIAAFKASLA